MSSAKRETQGLIVLLGVCVLLGVAVAVLGCFTSAGERAPQRVQNGSEPSPAEWAVATEMEKKSAGVKEAEEERVFGEAEDAFALNYRLERDRARSAQMEALEALAAAANTTPLARAEAEKKILELLALKEKELQLESLLLAQGFTGPLVVLNEEGATICVAGPPLTPVLASRIGDLATRVTRLPAERIVIVQRVK